jgi:UDP-glucose 4-epimerase
MNDKPPVVYGDGTQTRDFTYIQDVVDANLTLLESGLVDGEVLNIGSSDNIEIRTLATEIRDLLAPGLELEYDERYDADAEHTHADVSKANELLGYSPEYTIREGLKKFVNWYQENQEWYEPLVREP